MACLQQVFIFLRYSKRSIYSPNKFLQLARPSWFEAGRQQDCSEFLTHLLDTLQEEEKSCSPRQAPATESEITEPVASTEVNDKPAESNELLDDNQDEIMKSCENISVLRDESAEDQSEEEAKDTIDDQMLKISRVDKLGSASSLGMSRWSTEENLSIRDSRETLNRIDSRDALNLSRSNEKLQVDTDKMSGNDSQSNSSDSGIHSVESAHTTDTDHSSAPVTIVQRVFGGRMRTCFQCSQCSNKSEFNDWFTDLHLPIPQTGATVAAVAPQVQSQELKQALDSIGGGGNGDGVAVASTSQATETIQPQHQQPAALPQPPQKLSLSDLIRNYFEPELLVGENKYSCDTCETRTDAERTVTVTTAPEHLLITLLRFKYDTSTHRRVKIMTGCEYPQYMELPVSGGVKQGYRLHGVVIHSGYSSDGGHYYTWTRYLMVTLLRIFIIVHVQVI